MLYGYTQIDLYDGIRWMNEAREQDRVTLTKKLEKVCPHFHCMHLMFGERPNVNSQALGVVGLPN